MGDFEELLPRIERIEGWLRVEQARRLWDEASRVRSGGQIVEIGSYQGKSTIVLATGAPPGVTVYAIDPHAGNDRGPGEWSGAAEDGQADYDAFSRNLHEAGCAHRVRHVRQFSQLAQGSVIGPVDLLYVDGAHGYRPAVSDISEWGDRVPVGGTMLIHDAFSSVFVTLAVSRLLFFTGSWRYLGRDRSLVRYRREALTWQRRLANAGRQMACLPWFGRNLVIKALRTIGLESAGRVLGHEPGAGVY